MERQRGVRKSLEQAQLNICRGEFRYKLLVELADEQLLYLVSEKEGDHQKEQNHQAHQAPNDNDQPLENPADPTSGSRHFVLDWVVGCIHLTVDH
jgi:hypothetical protein